MADIVVNEKNGENNGKENSENGPGLEKETLSRNSHLHSLNEPGSEITHESVTPEKKDTNDTVPISDKTEGKLVADNGAVMRSPQRKSRSACRARSRDPKKCQMNFREMIGKHEMRNEELEQLEGDLRERLDMLECSMPAVMVWNILRTAQGAPPSTVRRLMEKQFQGVHSAGNIAIPSTPSQHYDHRVREVEAERKEAVRRAEEARALLTDKEAAIVERQKRLEEAKKCNQEKKERIQRLNREAAEVREAMKNARGDDTSCQTGECGAIRCKEKLLGDIGSLSSIGSTDLECFAKLQELAESEVCMKQQISELERREEVYMRTLQQADELWSKMESDSSSDVHELQEQLKLKTAANQHLADQVCKLEDEQEKLKKRLIICTDELAKFTDKMHADAEIGSKDDVATVVDRGIEAQAKTTTTSTSVSPQTVDVDSTAYPQTKDEESTFAPESEEKGISVSAKTFDKDIEAIVDLIDREVDRPIGMGVDTGVGDEALDDQTRKVHLSWESPSARPTKIPLEQQEKIPETLESSQWDDGYPPDTIPRDTVESSTGMDNVLDHKRVSTTEMPVQATVIMVEQPVGGSKAEDIAEIIGEIPKNIIPSKSDTVRDTDSVPMARALEDVAESSRITQEYVQPVSPEKLVDRHTTTIDEGNRATTDERHSELDESIEVIDEPATDEQRFEKLSETRDKDEKTIADRKKTDAHETTEKTDQSASNKKSIIERQTNDKDSDAISDQVRRNDQVQQQESEKKLVSNREPTIEKYNELMDKQTDNEIPKSEQKIEHSDPAKKIITEVELQEDDDKPTSTQKRSSERPTKIGKDSEKDPTKMSQDNKASIEKTDRPDSDKKDSFTERTKKVSKTSKVIRNKMEYDSTEDAQKTDYSDSEEKAVSKHTKSVSKYPKGLEKKERKDRSLKRKSRYTKEIETDDDEIPEAWKNWDWSKGCPPDGGCNILNSPTRVEDKRPRDVSTFETQVQATVEMRERSVGGRGSEDVAEIRREGKPTKDRIERNTDSTLKVEIPNTTEPMRKDADEIVLSREELRNWYNTVNNIHHTISQCPTCQFQVNATAPLMENINKHLRMTALADEKVPITNEEMRKSLAYMTERTIESLRDSRAEVGTPKKSKLLSAPDLESISSTNLNNLSADTSQLLEGDEKLSSEKDDIVDIPIARSTMQSEIENDITKSTDTLDRFQEAKPSQSDIGRNESVEQEKITAPVLLQPSLQVPVEDELFMALVKEPQPQEAEPDEALFREKSEAIIGSEDHQHESIMPSAIEEGKIMESEKKQEGPKEPPKKIVGVEKRKEEEGEKTERDNVDKSPKPKIEADKKLQPLGTSEACICSPRICRPVVTCIPEPYTEGTQTSSQMPRTLHRLKLKTKTENTWHSPDVIMWRRPLIWPRRREDKSTLTTIGVGTQADSTLGRERITHRKIDRKDDGTCSGLIPRKIEFGGPYEHTSRRHPDERLPTPVSDAVAELSNSLKLQPSTISDENEIAVTQYTGKSLTPKNSDLCCVDCGRPITPEPAFLSLTDSPPTTAKSQKGLMHALKKLTASTLCVERKKNLCCDCKVLHETRREQPKTTKDSTRDEELCCPLSSDTMNKKAKELKKTSKKKRKPEKKDQSVTANIPRSKQKKKAKNKKGPDDNSVSSIAESKIHSPFKHSGTSVTESCDEKSCNKIAPKTEVTVKHLVTEVPSSDAPPQCGCSGNSSVQVPYINYSSIFRTNITKNECHSSSSDESKNLKRLIK